MTHYTSTKTTDEVSEANTIRHSRRRLNTGLQKENMQGQTTANKTGKLIQHWPHLSDRSEPQVCVGNDYTEDDLWFDLTRITLGDGGILVVGLYPRDPHRVIRENGDVDTYQRDPRHCVIREQ